MNLHSDNYTFIEIGREAATIVMLVFIGIIGWKNTGWKKIRIFFLIAFGIWDIFYYIWLYVFIQWPKSLFEWDILFLIPLTLVGTGNRTGSYFSLANFNRLFINQ
ncbi:MAG: hypothetical protein MZV64_30285 [Ignavibacteriales bacterium]|nr:hypothetical protein [Ignavibacteriales bacterium]